MNTYDSRGQVPTYHETQEEVEETAAAAIRYIYEGETMDQPYDLRGLCVFGVIGALRLNDDALHGDDSKLTHDQRLRLVEVEDTVQTAVDSNMHYFPFGDNENKSRLDGSDLARLTGTKHFTGKVRIKGRSESRYARRRLSGQSSTPKPGPVTTKHQNS